MRLIKLSENYQNSKLENYYPKNKKILKENYNKILLLN